MIETHLLAYASYCSFAPIPSATAFGLLPPVNLAGMIAAGPRLKQSLIFAMSLACHAVPDTVYPFRPHAKTWVITL